MRWSCAAQLAYGGVLNLLWIAAITMAALAEKVLPAGSPLSRIFGSACVAGGAWLLLRFAT